MFVHLEPMVMKILNQLSARDLSHVAFAYSARNSGNPELHAAIEKRILELVKAGEVFDYLTMHNLIYHLIFRDNVNEKIWKHIIDSTLDQDDSLPIVYYKPFKHSKYYLQAKFPEWDLSDYVDRFYYAEKYFNQVQIDNYMTSDLRYLEIKSFMNQKCLVFPIVFMTEENLFNMHYVFH